MLKGIEFWNFVLSALTFIVGLVIGFVSWKWVRPADRRLKLLEASLARYNESIGTIKTAVIDASVRVDAGRHDREVESCLQVYSAFKQIITSSGIISLCRGLRDLEEIRANFKSKNDIASLAKFSAWLWKLIPKEFWTIAKDVDVSNAEIFVPAKVWHIYSALCLLIGAFQAQLLALHAQMEEPLVDLGQIRQRIDEVLPGEGEHLRMLGTQWYWWVIEGLRKSLVAEIRNAIGADPVDLGSVVALNAKVEDALKSSQNVPDELKAFMAKGL